MLGPMGGDDAETELARRRHEYLHEISARLHELRLDARERLAALVRFAVPEVADWCLVDLIERGALVRAAEGHWDEERRTGHLGKARPIAAAARETAHYPDPYRTGGGGLSEPAGRDRDGHHLAARPDDLHRQCREP